jgi:hypothetical protein
MASRNKKQRVLTFFTGGKRGQQQSGLTDRLGRIVRTVDDAHRKALASTARRVSPLISREVRAVFNVRRDELTGKFNIRTTRSSITAYGSTRRIALSQFGAKWGGPQSAGARATVLRGQTRIYPGAFIAPGRLQGGKADLVYERTGVVKVQQQGRYKGVKRESIGHIWGPSPRDMAFGRIKDRVGNPLPSSDPGIRTRVIEELGAFHFGELRRLYDVEMRRRG